MKKTTIIVIAILAVSLIFYTTNENQGNNGSESDQSTTLSDTEQMQVSPQTMKKIEAWKKENTVSTRRLSANDFEEYNLSDFWKEPYILGYIGSNFQRLYIAFQKIKRISTTE